MEQAQARKQGMSSPGKAHGCISIVPLPAGNDVVSIEQQLTATYRVLLSEPVPDRFLKLISQLGRH